MNLKCIKAPRRHTSIEISQETPAQKVFSLNYGGLGLCKLGMDANCHSVWNPRLVDY